jgi:hypothetical protein
LIIKASILGGEVVAYAERAARVNTNAGTTGDRVFSIGYCGMGGQPGTSGRAPTLEGWSGPISGEVSELAPLEMAYDAVP